MIHILTIEKIRAQLAKLPALMDRYQRGDIGFPEAVVGWLEDTEKELGNLRLTELSELAVLRGRILNASGEAPTADPFKKEKRSQRQTRRNAAAAEAADRAETILRSRIQQSENRLQAFEDKLCEGLTAFFLENPPSDTFASLSPPSATGQLWVALSEYGPARPLARYLSTALAATDRQHLLAQILQRMRSTPVVS